MSTATAPTKLRDLVRDVRVNLLEKQPRFWSDDELVRHLGNGAKLLWKRIIDLRQGHFETIDVTNVSMAASGTTLTGVPVDCFRITLIEPRDTTATGAYSNVVFKPKPYTSKEFADARTFTTQDLSSPTIIYYDLVQEGPPVNTVTVQVAPAVSSAMTLRFCYIRTFPIVTPDLNNPIPGESDVALVAYATAFAKAKLPNVGMPDPGWLEVFKAERDALLTALTPRQEQEVEEVEGIFEDRW